MSVQQLRKIREGQYVSIDDSYFYKYKLAVSSLPQHSWRIARIQEDEVTLEKTKNGVAYLTITLDRRYLNRQTRYKVE